MIFCMKTKKQVSFKSQCRLRRDLFFEYKSAIIFFDILLILAVLMNFGAVYITNKLVVDTIQAEHKVVVVEEQNPVKVEGFGQKATPQKSASFIAFLKHIYLMIGLVSSYIFLRFTYTTRTGMLFTMLLPTAFFIAMGLDFFNDLGVLVGLFW